MKKLTLILCAISNIFILTSCTEDSNELTTSIGKQNVPTNLAGITLRKENAISASESPYFLTQKIKITIDQSKEFDRILSTVPESEIKYSSETSTMFYLYEKYGLDKILGMKTPKEMAAEFRAMRQKYITPLLTKDSEKKVFA